MSRGSSRTLTGTQTFYHSYVASKHIYWMFRMGLKGQTALVRLFRVDVMMPPIRAGPSALPALLGRHHNIHPKHPNHSLIVLRHRQKKEKKGKIVSRYGFELATFAQLTAVVTSASSPRFGIRALHP